MNFFLNRESFFRNQISCKSLNVYRHEYKNSIIYFNMKRVILLHNPSFLKKKCCPIFGCILLVICEITLTLRHDAIFFEKRSTHTHSNWRQKNSSPLYILTARLLKKNFDPERSVTNGCFWQTKDDHAYTYILLKFMGAASSDVPKYTPRVCCCWCCPPPLFFFENFSSMLV